MNSRRGGNQVIPRPANWRYGDVPAWCGGLSHNDIPSIDEIVHRISQFTPSTAAFSQEFSQEWVATARHSAVLVPVTITKDGPSFVCTKRASHLKNHRGEISFPGGRVDEGETAVEAALRETEEEIALSRSRVSIIGELDSLTTFISNSVIVPIVGVIDNLGTLRPNLDEVDYVFTTSLAELTQPDTYHSEIWSTPRGELTIHFFDVNNETIWGATARILHQFIGVVCGNSPSSY